MCVNGGEIVVKGKMTKKIEMIFKYMEVTSRTKNWLL